MILPITHRDTIFAMHRMFLIITGVILLITLSACQAQETPPATLYIIDERESLVWQFTPGESATDILTRAQKDNLRPSDQILLNGAPIDPAQAIYENNAHLQIWRAASTTIASAEGETTFESLAPSVGHALAQMGVELYYADEISPPAATPISERVQITHTPARMLTVVSATGSTQIRSAAASVGQALASAGIPLLGLDSSFPGESASLPADGIVRVTRVQESIILLQKPLSFQNEFVASAELDLDTQELLQEGQQGLAISRIRIRTEDGVETTRATENEVTVRPARNRIVGYGTKITIRTEQTADGTIEYWRKITAWATSYKPCGAGQDRCYYGTSSGKKVQKGVIAVRPQWWRYMVGDPVYIPGYGFATIEDIGALHGKPWVDLGYTEEDYVPWAQWVTVYFLTPIPDTILYVLD
jgi:resuscitation-promoting factor RpfB